MSANTSFKKGSTAANLGIGLIHFGSYSGLLFTGSDYSRTPLINLSVEHGIIDNVGPGVISVGGIVGFRRASYTYKEFFGEGYKWSATDVFVGVRGIYHYQLSSNPKLDTYGGLTVGVRISKYSYKWDESYPDFLRSSSDSDTYTNAISGLFVGARYNFAENIGVFGEFGYDIALLKVGLSAKF